MKQHFAARLTPLASALALLALCGTASQAAAAGNCTAKKHNDAVAMAQQGQIELATRRLEAVVADCTESLGTPHGNTLRAMQSLVDVYAAQGQWQKVVPVLQNIVTVRSRKLGETDAQTLMVKNNLGMAYMQLGQLDKAEPLLQQVLAALTASAGEDAADTLRVMNNLASVYSHQGKVEKALPLQQKMLASLQASKGKSHPLTLVISNNLAESLQTLGRTEEAVTLSRQVLDELKASEGEKDPRTLVAMGNLGSLLMEQQQLDQARALFEQALQLGTDHKQPDMLKLRSNLAVLEMLQGHADKAIEMLQAVLADASQALGDQHPLVADVQLNLAEIYYQTSQPQLGWPLLLASHNSMLALYGAQHPRVIASLPELLAAAQQQGITPETLYRFDTQVLQQAESQLDEARKLLKITQ